jgi:CheY-like chemotaxis protein
LLHQTVAINSDLMAQKGVRTEIYVDGDLSHLPLNSVYLRQIVLNMLRTIALEASPETSGTTVSIHAKANAQTTEISIRALHSIVQRVIKSEVWQQTQKLLDAMNAKVEMQQAVNRLPLAPSLLKLSFPLTGGGIANKLVLNTPALTIRPVLLVIAESQTIVELLVGQLDQYKIIRVEAVASIIQVLQVNDKVAAVLSVHTLTDDELRKIRALIGLQAPILMYPIDTAGDQLRQLKTTYLRKPLDFNKLSTFVKSIPTNEGAASSNIIIVEDNPDTAALIAQTIRSISPGLNPHIASIAQDVFLLLGKLESAALLVDQSLPGISGIHLIQQIRETKRYENLPIILMSAYPTADEAVPVAVCNRLVIDHAVGLNLGVLLNCLI